MKLIKLNQKDNVAIAVEPIATGEVFTMKDFSVTCRQQSEIGCKIALCDIQKSMSVIKCGLPIGRAARNIQAGEPVAAKDLAQSSNSQKIFRGGCNPPEIHTNCTFSGYVRPDGRVGTRNEIWIVPLSEEAAEFSHSLADLCDTILFPNVDQVVSFSYPYLSQNREESLKALASLIHHQNAGGVLIPVLGEEGLNIKILKRLIEGMDNRRIRFWNCRTSEDVMEEGMKLIHKLAAAAGRFPREAIPAFELAVGMFCASPNVFTSITANPLLGVLSDKIVAQGGTVILACPQLPGSEEILSRQCLDQSIFEEAEKRIVHSGAETLSLPFFSTPEEKAAFYLQEGGTAPVSDVLSGRRVFRRSGFNLLVAPSASPASAAALAAAGAQIILTACGAVAPIPSPVPAVCIASSAPSEHDNTSWLDFNAGSLIKSKSMSQVSNELWNFLLAVCEGRQRAKNESYRHKSLFLNTPA